MDFPRHDLRENRHNQSDGNVSAAQLPLSPQQPRPRAERAISCRRALRKATDLTAAAKQNRMKAAVARERVLKLAMQAYEESIKLSPLERFHALERLLQVAPNWDQAPDVQTQAMPPMECVREQVLQTFRERRWAADPGYELEPARKRKTAVRSLRVGGSGRSLLACVQSPDVEQTTDRVENEDPTSHLQDEGGSLSSKGNEEHEPVRSAVSANPEEQTSRSTSLRVLISATPELEFSKQCPVVPTSQKSLHSEEELSLLFASSRWLAGNVPRMPRRRKRFAGVAHVKALFGGNHRTVRPSLCVVSAAPGLFTLNRQQTRAQKRSWLCTVAAKSAMVARSKAKLHTAAALASGVSRGASRAAPRAKAVVTPNCQTARFFDQVTTRLRAIMKLPEFTTQRERPLTQWRSFRKTVPRRMLHLSVLVDQVKVDSSLQRKAAMLRLRCGRLRPMSTPRPAAKAPIGLGSLLPAVTSFARKQAVFNGASPFGAAATSMASSNISQRRPLHVQRQGLRGLLMGQPVDFLDERLMLEPQREPGRAGQHALQRILLTSTGENTPTTPRPATSPALAFMSRKLCGSCCDTASTTLPSTPWPVSRPLSTPVTRPGTVSSTPTHTSILPQLLPASDTDDVSSEDRTRPHESPWLGFSLSNIENVCVSKPLRQHSPPLFSPHNHRHIADSVREQQSMLREQLLHNHLIHRHFRQKSPWLAIGHQPHQESERQRLERQEANGRAMRAIQAQQPPEPDDGREGLRMDLKRVRDHLLRRRTPH